MSVLVCDDGYNKSFIDRSGSIDSCEIVENIEDKHLSSFGNTFVEITEEDIAALRQGKVLRHDDDEYVHFFAMKVDAKNNRPN